MCNDDNRSIDTNTANSIHDTYCRLFVRFMGAKIRLSEQNTKQKERFFIFVCIFEREYLGHSQRYD